MGYFPVRYNSRVIIYERKMLIKLATGLVVMGGDLKSEGGGFECQHLILDGHFFTLICLFEKDRK